MAKRIIFREEAQEKIARGVDIIADAVAATMGPGGQVVAIDAGWGTPMTTKDGVTVARSVELKDRFEKMGSELVKEAAGKTNEIAGDGTTGATVLSRAIYAEGRKRVAAGENPVHVKAEVERDAADVAERLKAMAQPVETLEKLEHVAGVSANDAALGKIIAGIIHDAGPDGIVTVEESPTVGVTTDMTKGMKIDAGYAYPLVTNPQRMLVEISDASILVTDRRITSQEELLPLLKSLKEKGKDKLLIFCDGIEGLALAFVLDNAQRGVFSTFAVKSPGLGEVKKERLMDLCASVGATFVSDELGKSLKNVTPEMLGSARQVTISRDTTVIVSGGGKQEDVDTRIAAVKARLETEHNEYDRDRLKERLGRLTGAVGVIKVGGANDVEIKEKKQRVEDAVNAARAAQAEGIVPGGGTALVAASRHLPPNSILRRACEWPLKTIAENAGKNGEVVLEKTLTLPQNEGWDAAKDEWCDLLERGIIDPAKVVRTALQNAASVAGLLLTTKAMVAIEEEEKK